MASIVLVLPAPFRPSTATTSPWPACRSTPLTATTDPYRTTRPDTSTAGGSVVDMGDRTYRDVLLPKEAANTSGAGCYPARVGQSWMEPAAKAAARHPRPGGPMIEARNLTKRYGNTVAVDDLSFDVQPGMVTGFLGPNGAGKTTTMRMILGLDRPSNGEVTIGGRRYRDLPAPLHEVGALLDAKAVHGGRSAYNHLLCLAQSNGIPRKRVETVLGIVGLESVARRRAGRLLAGDGPTARHRGGAAGRSGDPDVRRAGQRTRPRGHRLGPHPHAGPGRRRAHRAGVQPSDERDGPDRRSPHRHRAGPAHPRRRGQRVRRVQLPPVGPGAITAGRRAGGASAAPPGRRCGPLTDGLHRGDGPRRRRHRRAGGGQRGWCCTN